MWNLTAVAYLVFLIWCYVPEHILNSWGIYYIPNKYYALALPAWFGVSCVTIVTLYIAYSMISIHPRHSYFTMQDRHTVLSNPIKDHDPLSGKH